MDKSTAKTAAEFKVGDWVKAVLCNGERWSGYITMVHCHVIHAKTSSGESLAFAPIQIIKGTTGELNIHASGTCPQCGDKGQWKALALICPVHGRFAG